ncbi:SoxB-like sarcosine oxidase subunit beta [Desulfocucumis palustris]|uniref:SoxB-like sarcosine oxidase subunit beta n=1 Tax=Desulfocucumis palustris TaxID=1898651 RepID=A0A2L2X8R0_9FIRM|nr:FAD-binding oxidoreductase [Desulfocucumis palustris]GBF32400.1 SoxB-like sarcosine oxidase subunit beta [Desulfocucumis palustris]
MSKKADVVVIGGGVHGCSIAYHLAKKGYKKIVLLEKSYLASSGTGRSAAGIRHQFGTEINIRLSATSVKMMENLAQELDYPRGIDLMQGGYMMLAYTESQLEQFKTNAALQNSLMNAGTRILTVDEILKIVPTLNTEGVVGASFNEKDGHVDPFHVTQAYADAAARLGVEIMTRTEAVDIRVAGGRVTGVVINSGEVIETPVVVNAAGPYGALIGKMVGLDIPLYPERHQILVTEPLEMFLPCMVISFTHGTYFKQTPHGSLLLGVGDPEHEVKDFNEESTWQFLEDVARKITYHMPVLKKVRVVRQWAGLYDMTPDSQAILGKTGVEGFYLDVGWSGHGLQLGPVVGKIMAQVISGEEPDIDISVMNLERFKTGALIPEPACV